MNLTLEVRVLYWQHGCSVTVRPAKALTHCKLPGQIGGETWPRGLVEKFVNPGVDDKPSGFIASNKANRLRHPVWLNVGKCQRKIDQLRSLLFFDSNFCHPFLLSPSQSQDPQRRNIANLRVLRLRRGKTG